MVMYKYKRIKLKDGTTRDEHRLIMENHIGRKLNCNEVVHHKNGNHRDNRIENLELLDVSVHSREHYLKGDLYKLKPEDLGKAKCEIRNNVKYYFCNSCKKMICESDFYKDNDRWNGLKSFCKKCCNKKRKMLL